MNKSKLRITLAALAFGSFLGFICAGVYELVRPESPKNSYYVLQQDFERPVASDGEPNLLTTGASFTDLAPVPDGQLATSPWFLFPVVAGVTAAAVGFSAAIAGISLIKE
ncbi:hypothetical protein [Rhodococcus sp. 1168]|uniref:hypothetical protein n=1 Tax=Rhodococcus sp. 1168 TaxID=2018041 RepID=UPI000F73F6C7|nr:hypothetical protein [Rhodococcus sp. 1168]